MGWIDESDFKSKNQDATGSDHATQEPAGSQLGADKESEGTGSIGRMSLQFWNSQVISHLLQKLIQGLSWKDPQPLHVYDDKMSRTKCSMRSLRRSMTSENRHA